MPDGQLRVERLVGGVQGIGTAGIIDARFSKPSWMA